MPPDVVAWLPIGLFAALLVTAAVYDFFLRRIPNWTVVGLILLFVVCAWLKLTPVTWPSGLAAFAIALVCSGALYLLGWLGAGDSKLFAAAALFAGLDNLLLLVLATTLAGGIYAVVVLCIRPKEVLRGMTARGRADGKLRGIPYGVAIAAGALTMAVVNLNLPPSAHAAHPTPAAQAPITNAT